MAYIGETNKAAALQQMNIYLASLGCVRNQVDSEIMMGRLTEAGHTVCDDPEQADVIVVNTCAFIESATEEAIDEILALSEWKKRGPAKK